MPSTSPNRPNVVVCLCDQLRAMDVGCYGSSFVKTPNIDALARQGVRFEIACSNNPVCTPGRSILLSGQYSRSCLGKLGNCDEPVPERNVFPGTTMAEAFGRAGYRTGLIGKWHIEPHPGKLGFDYAFFPRFRHRYTGQTYLDMDGNERLVEGFGNEAEQDELLRFLETDKGEPFFLYYNISQPHMPLDDMPEKYKKMYSPADISLRPNVFEDGKPAYDERWFSIYLWDYLFYMEHLPYTEKLPEGFDLRHLTALYYGAIAWADDQLGELMRQLSAAGLDENTIVVFTSDHGDNLGSHGIFNKDRLYEESIRVPMIYRSPGMSSRKIDTQVASLVDVMPTTLALAGVDIPDCVQGTDLSSVVTGSEKTTGENAALIETTNGEVGIRTLTHLYGLKRATLHEPYVFFDLTNDPLQADNLAVSSESGSVAEDLRERVLKWDRETRFSTSE